MDRLHMMTTFVAVVDAGSFAAASRKLALSPPAVTRAVAELERQLGVQLLTRSTRAMRLTEAGALYAEDCRRILAEIEEAESSAKGENASVRGTLVITAPVLFGRMRVAPVVREFLEANPEVSVRALFVDRIVNFMDEGVDVAVRIGQLPDSSLRALRIGAVRQVCCASPDYLRRHGTPREPGDLASHVVVCASGLSPTTEWRFAGGRVVHVTPRLATSDNEVAVEAALAGFGITRLLSYQVEAHVHAGRLALLLEAFEPVARPVHLLHAALGQGSAKVRTFLDLAAQRLR